MLLPMNVGNLTTKNGGIMHHLLSLILLAVSFVVFGSRANAQIDVVRTGVSGQGCSPRETSITMSPGNSAFSILYSGMQVEAIGSKTQDRKVCFVDIDFGIPVGTQLEFVEVQYRGFMSLLNSNSQGNISNHHYFLNGVTEMPNGNRQGGGLLSGGVRFNQYGPFSDQVTWDARFTQGDGKIKSISRCNGSAKLRIDTTVLAAIGPIDPNSSEPGESIVALDTADGALVTRYEMILRPCDEKNKRYEKICKQGTCTYFDPRTGRSIKQP